MRTTLTLDDDVAAVIERLRRERDEPLKALINAALREGLKQMTTPAVRKPFATASVDLGTCRFPDIDNVADVLALADGDAAP
jgi:hypothetical protein